MKESKIKIMNNMIKNVNGFIKILLKLYNYHIVGVFIILFFTFSLFNYHFIPDYLNLSYIEKPTEFLLTLWGVIISSASIILTILLVVYSSSSKYIKRNSTDFIIDNPWIKISFSLFGGSFLFLSLSILLINILDNNAALTILYTSFFITIIYFFVQFPLIIMSLKYSNSFNRIKKVSDNITLEDINCILNPPEIEDHIVFIEEMEKNRIIILKDIAISAIKDNDWSLPQIIISELYHKLILSINNKTTENDVSINLYAFNFICYHIKNNAIECNDNITINVLINYSVKTHVYFIDNEIRYLRENYFDKFIKDFFRSIVESKQFYDVQCRLIEEACQIISLQIESIKYTDEEFPTFYFNNDRIEKGIKVIHKNDLHNNYSFYVINELPEILFDTLLYAIKMGNKNVYDQYNFSVQNLLISIYDSENLTEFQRESIFDAFFSLGYKISDTAIKYEIYENIEIISNLFISNWIVKQRKKAYYCLFYFSDLIQKLNNANALSKEYIYDFFHIARDISDKKFDADLKSDSINLIIQTGIYIFEQKNTSEIVKKEVLGHLNAINNIYLEKEKDLNDVRDKFSSKINLLKHKRSD